MARLLTFGLGGNAPQLLLLGFGESAVQATVSEGVQFGADEVAGFTFAVTVTEALELGVAQTGLEKDRRDKYMIAEIARGTLTGGPDSLPDLPLSIISYSGSTRVTGEDYLSIIVGNTPGLQTAIDARPNGDLLLDVGIRDNLGTETLLTLIDVNLEEVRPDQGPTTSKIALSGYKGVTYSNPQPRDVAKVNYTSVSSGRQRVRHPGIETDVRPGDTITAGTISFVVDQISYSSTVAQAQTEFSEAEG